MVKFLLFFIFPVAASNSTDSYHTLMLYLDIDLFVFSFNGNIVRLLDPRLAPAISWGKQALLNDNV